MEGVCPGSVEPFYQGYQSIRRLPEDHALRAQLYQLLLCLENVVVWNRPSSEARCPQEKAKLLSLLRALESG